MSVIELTSELVRTPGMNPMGREPWEGTGEKGIAQKIGDVLSAVTTNIQMDEPLPGRPNVTAFADFGCAETVMFEAHLDTVPNTNMTIEPFAAEIRDGKLYGRGACDCRGPMAAMLNAVLTASKKSPKRNVLFVSVCDEEYRFTGVHHWCASRAPEWSKRVAFAVVGEPTGLKPILAHKGVARWQAIARGRAAHSSSPEMGVNAIYAMMPFVSALEKHALELASGRRDPRLGAASLSVGTIAGGSAVNIIPDRCAIEIDRRVLPGETRKSITAPVAELARRYGIDLLPTYVEGAPLITDGESPAATAIDGALAACGLPVTPDYVHYCTDAGFYHDAGISTVVFGPGYIAQAHTADEFIELEQLEQGTRVFEALICG